MMKLLSSVLFLFSWLLFVACNKEIPNDNNTSLLFDSIPAVKPVVPIINEASGIADSKANAGFLWVEEDSGNPTELYLLGYDGKVLKKVFIKGVVNRGWEDMAISGNDIYIGNIGDNNQVHTDYSIYYFAEPLSSADTVTNITTIGFQYPDGSHDADAFLIDPATKDIFIITKRDNPSRIYKLSFPYDIISLNTVNLSGSLAYSDVTSAAITQDGKEILIKTYTAINYYTRKPGETIEQTLQQPYTQLPYTPEPQGEAITFANNNSGFFTLSETGFSTIQNLYFYPRK